MCVCLSTVRGLGWSHDLWFRLCNGNAFSWASEPKMVPVKWQTIFPLKRGHNGSTQYIKLLSSPLMFQKLKLDVSSHPISFNKNDHYLMNSQKSPNWNHKSCLLAGHPSLETTSLLGLPMNSACSWQMGPWKSFWRPNVSKLVPMIFVLIFMLFLFDFHWL